VTQVVCRTTSCTFGGILTQDLRFEPATRALLYEFPEVNLDATVKKRNRPVPSLLILDLRGWSLAILLPRATSAYRVPTENYLPCQSRPKLTSFSRCKDSSHVSQVAAQLDATWSSLLEDHPTHKEGYSTSKYWGHKSLIRSQSDLWQA